MWEYNLTLKKLHICMGFYINSLVLGFEMLRQSHVKLVLWLAITWFLIVKLLSQKSLLLFYFFVIFFTLFSLIDFHANRDEDYIFCYLWHLVIFLWNNDFHIPLVRRLNSKWQKFVWVCGYCWSCQRCKSRGGAQSIQLSITSDLILKSFELRKVRRIF